MPSRTKVLCECDSPEIPPLLAALSRTTCSTERAECMAERRGVSERYLENKGNVAAVQFTRTGPKNRSLRMASRLSDGGRDAEDSELVSAKTSSHPKAAQFGKGSDFGATLGGNRCFEIRTSYRGALNASQLFPSSPSAYPLYPDTPRLLQGLSPVRRLPLRYLLALSVGNRPFPPLLLSFKNPFSTKCSSPALRSSPSLSRHPPFSPSTPRWKCKSVSCSVECFAESDSSTTAARRRLPLIPLTIRPTVELSVLLRIDSCKMLTPLSIFSPDSFAQPMSSTTPVRAPASPVSAPPRALPVPLSAPRPEAASTPPTSPTAKTGEFSNIFFVIPLVLTPASQWIRRHRLQHRQRIVAMCSWIVHRLQLRFRIHSRSRRVRDHHSLQRRSQLWIRQSSPSPSPRIRR